MEINSDLVVGGTGYKQPVVNRTVIGSYRTYEVLDIELDQLKEGDDGGIILNISIALLSSAISFVVTYTTCDFKSAFVKGVFVALSFAFALFGLLLILMWRKKGKKIQSVYEKIKGRNSEQ